MRLYVEGERLLDQMQPEEGLALLKAAFDTRCGVAHDAFELEAVPRVLVSASSEMAEVAALLSFGPLASSQLGARGRRVAGLGGGDHFIALDPAFTTVHAHALGDVGVRASLPCVLIRIFAQVQVLLHTVRAV